MIPYRSGHESMEEKLFTARTRVVELERTCATLREERVKDLERIEQLKTCKPFQENAKRLTRRVSLWAFNIGWFAGIFGHFIMHHTMKAPTPSTLGTILLVVAYCMTVFGATFMNSAIRDWILDKEMKKS